MLKYTDRRILKMFLTFIVVVW